MSFDGNECLAAGVLGYVGPWRDESEYLHWFHGIQIFFAAERELMLVWSLIERPAYYARYCDVAERNGVDRTVERLLVLAERVIGRIDSVPYVDDAAEITVIGKRVAGK